MILRIKIKPGTYFAESSQPHYNSLAAASPDLATRPTFRGNSYIRKVPLRCHWQRRGICAAIDTGKNLFVDSGERSETQRNKYIFEFRLIHN
jgi:hypothetical protein